MFYIYFCYVVKGWYYFFVCIVYTDIHRLTTRVHSEKRIIRRFRRCANVIE